MPDPTPQTYTVLAQDRDGGQVLTECETTIPAAEVALRYVLEHPGEQPLIVFQGSARPLWVSDEEHAQQLLKDLEAYVADDATADADAPIDLKTW